MESSSVASLHRVSNAFKVQTDSVTDSTSPAAMAELEDEFRNILLSHTWTELISLADDRSSTCTDSSYSAYSLQEETNTNSDTNSIPIKAVHELRRMAERMIAAGHSRQCVEVYAGARRTGLYESFKKLGIEKLSLKNVQRLEWTVQQLEIRRWIRAAYICFRVIFAGEKRLFEQVFKGLRTEIGGDVCFRETIEDFAVRLFNFVGAICGGRLSSEKLFNILDLHEVLSDLLPDIQAIFGSKSGEHIREQVMGLLSTLSQAASETLSELERAITGEQDFPILGGSIDPLARYVMNYVCSMAGDYKQNLEGLILSEPSTHDFDFSEFEGRAASRLEVHLVWIIGLLKIKLDGKSKQHNDASLAHLFMMNNVHYIVGKIESSSALTEILGRDYLNKLTEECRLAATSYRQMTWGRVLHCLTYDNSGVFSGVFKRGPRQRLKAFNGKFEEMITTQAIWVVPDTQLCEELRISIVEVLVPVYKSFLEKYRSQIESVANTLRITSSTHRRMLGKNSWICLKAH